jgi:ribonuclease D
MPVSPTIKLYKNDLPAGLVFPNGVAIDSETMGLNPQRDRLCVVQLSAGDGSAHLVQFDGKDWSAPRLKALLADPAALKIFHFARFDMASGTWGPAAAVYCTKIASNWFASHRPARPERPVRVAGISCPTAASSTGVQTS